MKCCYIYLLTANHSISITIELSSLSAGFNPCHDTRDRLILADVAPEQATHITNNLYLFF